MALAAGEKLGPYEIVSLLGKGGMGEVYKARDPRLNRDVAIKVSQDEFSERFEREARSIAALNHPNVCQIYDVGPNYLVMEFIEGAPVAPPDSPRKLLDMAVQIADGLAAAHAAGIVHRDLKPDNIFLTRDGRIRILDFGLAKAASGSNDETRSVAIDITDPGSTVGTIAYMSPEQARGEVDLTAQSDQFSLGLVLYELATGKRAFQRGSGAETMVAIIREDAEPLPASVPAPLRWIIERLMAKDPAERYDSTRDLYRELRQVRERFSESVVIPLHQPRRAVPWIGVAGLILGALLAALLTTPPPPDLSALKFTPIAREEATEANPHWSPDGKSIAYKAAIHGIYQMFTKAVGSRETTQLTHAESDCEATSWSPDGTTVYYESSGGLWAVSASGGSTELVLENARSVAHHPDGKTLVFNRAGKTWVSTIQGGVPKELPLLPNTQVNPISFSPDGSLLLVGHGSIEFWIVPWPSGTPRSLGRIGSRSAWLPDSRHLISAPFDGNGLVLVDVTDASSRVICSTQAKVDGVSVSPDGKKLAYTSLATSWEVIEISLPEGRVHTVLTGGGIHWQPEWAPSGTHFLFSTGESAPRIFIEDHASAEGFSRRVAETPNGATYNPRWAPDGTRFLFTELLKGRRKVMISNATGDRQTGIADIDLQTTYAWSPDGQWIVFVRTVEGKPKLVKMKPVPRAAEITIAGAVPAVFSYSTTQWSPTGEWIAYSSAEGVSMISPDGGTPRILTPRKLSAFSFSKDGRQVYGIFRNTTGEGAQWQLFSFDVKTGAEKMLAPVELPASANNIFGFSIHPDGKRFLTSIAKWPTDIWMLEGWDAPQKTWLERLLKR